MSLENVAAALVATLKLVMSARREGLQEVSQTGVGAQSEQYSEQCPEAFLWRWQRQSATLCARSFQLELIALYQRCFEAAKG